MRYAVLRVLVFSFLCSSIKAQLNADFKMDKAGGCSPFSVFFTNTTSGASAAATYEWNFGNGNTSVLKDAGAVYYQEKTYTVKLTVKEGSQTSIQTKTITVYKTPIVDFTFSPDNGCLPMPVNFTSSSSAGDGNISSYHWDFGDGSVQQSFSSSVSHTYNLKQTATVSLTAVNSFGCANTLSKENIIKVHPSLKAGFGADNTIHCDAPGLVNFSNSSSGPGILSYEWNFGDGTTSTQQSPSHTYTKKGTYPVKLTVRSSEGCTDVMTRDAYINVADFISDIQVPSLICNTTNVVFNNIASPSPNQTSWFVDGVESYYSSSALSYVFFTPGTHTIELVNRFANCEQRVSKQIEVKPRPELAGFVSTIKGLCGAPVEVEFKDTTATAVSWQWNFNYYGNNSIVHATTKQASYTYPSDNWYYTSLTVKNADGCSANVIQQVAISKPLVGIDFTDAAGYGACDSLTKSFAVRSTEPITKYLWDFGDGTTSTEKEPTHTYNKPGSYSVKLNYTTANGCTGVTQGSYGLMVIRKPVVDFTVEPVVCGNSYVFFQNKSTGDFGTPAWDFGDNSGIQYHDSHRYQEAGEYDVTLIGMNGYCNDTITKHAVIKAIPPFPRIGAVTNTCDGTRGLVTISDQTSSATKWTWDFGDGTSVSYNSYQPTVSHTFTKSGRYNVVLTTEGDDNGCKLKDSTLVFITLKSNPVLTFDNNGVACVNEGATFHVRGLEENILHLSDMSNRYYFKKWEYDDGRPLNGTYQNNVWEWYLNVDGTLWSNEIKDGKIRLITTSYWMGCEDTTNYAPISFKGVKAGFEIVSDNVCFKQPVILKDTSRTTGGNTIVSWEWNFGDGNIKTTSQGGTISHVYANPGTYYVTLKVTDASGCSSNTSASYSYVRVVGPKAAFGTSTGNTVQLNTTVNFYNNTNTANTNGVTYLWDFGNGVTSTAYSPSYTYIVPGDYVVVLIARNTQIQCNDTARQTITVKNFNTGFTANTSFIGNYSSCPPVRANFVNTSTNYTRLVWDFGDGFGLEDHPYPHHVYGKPGTYIVTLNVYGYNGLTGVYKDTIFVGTLGATIKADDLEGCIGNKVLLNAPTHIGATSYVWDFGDGYVANDSDSFFVHAYLTAGSYTPSLLVKDANGCSSSVTLAGKVVIHPDPIISISPSSALVCKTNGIQLQATGAAVYAWSPVDGLNNAAISSPLALPATTTNYTVKGTDINGCIGTATTTVTVPKPFAMNVTENFDVCKGSSVQINATGADTYKWINTTTGLNGTQVANPVATPLASTVYTVVGYDQYKCYSDTAKVNVMVRPLPSVNAGADIEVVYGSENKLSPIAGNDVVRWSWAPSDFLSCTNCPSPVSKPYTPMEYVVSVYNSYNCMAKDTIRIKATCTEGGVYIPTAFTPDQDGKNDLFTINGSGISIIRSLRIYNRWGEIIFEKKDFYPNSSINAWDGRYKGVDAPAGTYVYFAEMECNIGETFTRKGTVTLIR